MGYFAYGRTLTGAWIETKWCMARCIANGVAPSRVRGLKQREAEDVNA